MWNKLLAFTFITLIVTTLFLSTASAASAFSTLYLTPARKSIKIGDSLDVQLRLNTDNDKINAVAAYFTYPQDLIELSPLAISSPFEITAENENTRGFVRLGLGNIEPIAGDVLLATFTITGKKEGNVTISFTEGSAAARYEDSSDALSLARSTGGFYTIVQTQQKSQPPNNADSFILNFLQFLHRL